MSALIDLAISLIQRVFVGSYASLFASLEGIIPDGILSNMTGSISVLGFAVPAFLVYAFLLGD